MNLWDYVATVVAQTKRSPDPVAGITGDPVLHITHLMITEPMPVTAEIVERYALDSPRQVFVVYTEGAADIVSGDVLVVDGVDNPIRGISVWKEPESCTEVIFEVVQ